MNPGPVARVLAYRAPERPHPGVRRLVPPEPRGHSEPPAAHIAREGLREFDGIFGATYFKWDFVCLFKLHWQFN